MQLVIIAGGLGTRLRPLTLHRPKALVPLVDRPQIAHILDALPPSCDEVIVAVNYMFEQVRDFFRERQFGVAVRVVEETVPMGTAGAIKSLQRWLNGPFAVYNGDVVDTIEFDRLVAAHEKAQGIATIAVWPLDDPPVYVAAGAYVEGRVGPHVVLGKACRIGRASLRNATLLEGVSVDDKAEVTASIIGAGAAIGEGAHVRDSILGDTVQVSPHATIVDERVTA